MLKKLVLEINRAACYSVQVSGTSLLSVCHFHYLEFQNQKMVLD